MLSHNIFKKLVTFFTTFAMIVSTLSLQSIRAASITPEYVNLMGVNSYFANGTPITIEEARNGTAIWYMDGGNKVYVNSSGVLGDELSHFNIYGGSLNSPYEGDVHITMNGGSIGSIYGGGVNESGTVTGNIYITVNGGSVVNVSGSGDYSADVTGNSYIQVNGGSINDKLMLASSNLHGNTYVCVEEEAQINKISANKYANVEVKGTTNILCKNETHIALGITGYIHKNGNDYEVLGNVEIPPMFSFTINEGESLIVDKGESINNQGTLQNQGTIYVRDFDAISGNDISGTGTIVYECPYFSSEAFNDLSLYVNGVPQSEVKYLTEGNRTYVESDFGNVLVKVDDSYYYTN